MTKKPEGLYSTRSSTRQFLFNKTHAKHQDDDSLDRTSSASLLELSKLYPDILSGTSFINQGMDYLKDASKFGAMAIRIDEDSAGAKDNMKPMVEIRTDAVNVIDNVCKSKRGIWGQIDDDRLGVFFSEGNDTACLEIAESIQTDLAKIRNKTITIGVASYPRIDYAKNQILDNACKALDHATFFGPNSAVVFDAVSLNISGDVLYERGDIYGAIDEFQRALKIDPSNANVYNSIGVCYGVEKVFDKALESFKTAMRLDPTEVMALYNAGLVEMLTGNRESALAYFLKANSMGEDVFEVLLQTGRCHLELRNFEEAVQFLTRATRLKPESGTALSCLGECYAAMEMADDAIQVFISALKKKPNDAAALSGLGRLYEIKDENAEIAIIFCKQSIELSPKNGLFRYRLGRLYLKQNLFIEALEEFKKANELGHDSVKYIKDIQERLSAGNS